MSIYENVPSSVIFAGVRYRTDGKQMIKDIGLSSFDWGVPVPPAQPSAAEAITGNLEAGTYKIQMVAANKWGYMGNPRSDGPVSVVVSTDDYKIAITSIPTFHDPQVAYIRFYISYPGTTDPLYYAGEVANGTATLNITAHHSNWSTSDYLEPGYLAQDYDDIMAGPFRYAVPATKRYVEVYDDRIFAGGELIISDGLVSATDGSDIMTSTIACEANASWVGKYIVLHNENIAYEISEIHTPQRWKLTRNYETPAWRTADPSDVTYTLTGNVHEVVFSEQGEPEYFPSINLLYVGRDEGGSLTGLRTMGDEMIAATDRSLHAIYRSGSSYQPYGLRRTHSPVGCTAYRSMVVAQGGLFFYGGDGFYVYGNNTAVNISDKRLGKIHLDFNEDLIPYIVGAYHNEKIFWAVPFDDSTYLDRLLVFDLKTKEWDLYWQTFQIIDMAAVISRTTGKHYLLISQVAGDNYSLLYFDEGFENDACYNADYSGTVDTSTNDSITDDSATFPIGGGGLAGVPFYIWNGTGSGQELRIKSNTATTLVFASDFTSAPDTTSQYLVGCIRGRARSHKEIVGRPHDEKTFVELELGMGAD